MNQKVTDCEVLCVGRETDEETRRCIASASSSDRRIKAVLVSQPGVVAAMNAGLREAQGSLISFMDDDAVAPPHWLDVVVKHFELHPECGGVGGQDRLQTDDPRLSNPGPVKTVGSYSFFGRFSATHHCPVLEEYIVVDTLKGVNMTYRRDLIANLKIGDGLRGGYGPQVGHEQGFAAAVVRAGKECHFVRDAWVLHYISPRHENSERLDHTTQFERDASYNYAYTLGRYQPLRIVVAAFLWKIVIGSRFIPGVARLMKHPTKWHITMMHLSPMCQGVFTGVRDRSRKTC
jgi:GT2 family glycosyltransferase